MIRIDIQRTDFFKENTSDENDKYFYTCGQKFLHNIDNFYYNVYLKNDSNENEKFDNLLHKLLEVKELLKVKKKGDLIEFENTGLHVRAKSYKFYNLCLSDPDRFDIFMSEYIPNDVTARIIVQIRSNVLWLEGYTKILIETFNRLQVILEPYGLEIERTLENRNDMCYHTNMIQNPDKEFSDARLNRYLHTTQEIYSKVGRIRRKSKNKLSIEYFSLGNRKSNSLFERFYNKSREVIELGYKGYFFQIWKQNGLISEYDMFCYEFAYKKKNYEGIYEGMLRFYLKYGKDQDRKEGIWNLLNDKDTRLSDIEDYAISFMPKVTVILNIEFETKRTFYRSADAQIDLLPKRNNVPGQIVRLFQILDNRKIFLDYITSETVAFKHCEMKYCAWWQRLRSLKIQSNVMDYELARQYNKNIDQEGLVKRISNMIGTLATYDKRTDSNFVEDMSYLLSNINDNHMANINLIEIETGEILSDMESKILEKYAAYKEKKYRAVKNRLPSNPPKSDR